MRIVNEVTLKLKLKHFKILADNHEFNIYRINHLRHLYSNIFRYIFSKIFLYIHNNVISITVGVRIL